MFFAPFSTDPEHIDLNADGKPVIIYNSDVVQYFGMPEARGRDHAMEPTPELAAQLDKDRREAAEAMTPEQRILAGPDLFDMCVIMMRAGIRHQHPDANDDEVERILLERLRSAERNGNNR